MKRSTPTDDLPAAGEDGGLTLRLLGEPALIRRDASGEEVRVLSVGKPLALLTYLAVTPQHEATRELLAEMFWGGGCVSDPAHSLRNALVSLKNSIGAEWLASTASRCRLVHALPSDLDALTAALRDGRMSEAIARYTGEFFAGFAAPGCQQFEHWCDSLRHRVRTDVANAADVLVHRLLDEGHARQAADVAKRMAEIEPLGQRARRAVIEALIAAGDDLGALTEAAVLEQWLGAEELDAEPSTIAIIAQARRGRSGGRRSSGETVNPLTPDLVGREAEFAELMAALDRARGGSPAFVAVSGGAGIGKSRLLADAANRLRAERVRVVAVGALPGERDVPGALLAALVGALAPLVEADRVSPAAARVLASLDPSLAERYGVAPDASATDQLLRRAFAMRELLGAVAERRPTVVFIDDLHWADDASVDALLAALTRLNEARLAVVTASRPGARHPLPPERAVIVSLRPLTADQIAQLVASIRPLPNQPWVGELCCSLLGASGGVPLFAILALRSVEEAGLLVAGAAEWACADPLGLVRHLTQGTVLSLSLRDLSPDAGRMLAMLGLAGRAIPTEFLDDGSDTGSVERAAALADLERRALVIRQSDRCEIAHDLVADAVLAAISEDDLQSWTRSLATAMIGTGELRWVERGARLLANVASGDEMARALAPALTRLPSAQIVALDTTIRGWLGQSKEHEALAADIVKRLPPALRWRRYRRHAWGAAAVVVLAASAMAWRTDHPDVPPDATLSVSIGLSGKTPQSLDVPLREAGWNASEPARGTLRAIASDSGSVLVRLGGALVSYTARARLMEKVFDDSGGSEVVRESQDGARVRLTYSPWDDVPESWSPDGRNVALSTSRWSNVRHHRVAILSTRTGAVRPVSASKGIEGPAHWSPDGSRLFFLRRFLDGQQPEFCVVDVDGVGETCDANSASPAAAPLGWMDATHVLATRAPTDSSSEIVMIAPDSAWHSLRLLSGVFAPSLSPNGRWLAWHVGNTAVGTVRVAPLADLTRARVVEMPGTNLSAGLLGWTTQGVPSPFVDSLIFDAQSDTIFAGVPHRAFVHAHWSNGATTPAARVRWQVDEHSGVRVDAQGVIVATRLGRFVVTATVGGWRTASRAFVAVLPHTAEVFTESWRHGLGGWRVFGDPPPQIVSDARLGSALSNEGDGSYFSGAYLIRAVRAQFGVVIDARMRTPVTELQWQSLDLDLRVVTDTTELARWDHRSGYMPRTGDSPGLNSCGLVYPGVEGVAGRRRATLIVEQVGAPVFDARPLGSGATWRLRIQVLPDGRCGIAVNGRPLQVSMSRFEPGTKLMLVTYGNSWHSRMLLGPVTVRSGVPTDIDWTDVSAAPATRKRATPTHAVTARTTPRPPK